MNSEGFDGDFRIALVVPTLNRPILLQELLSALPSQSLIPKLVIVVDASPEIFSREIKGIQVEVIGSPVRSAAHQRNMGIERVLASDSAFDFCFFLDDDVTIPSNYFEALCSTLKLSKVSGVSGLAISQGEIFPRNSRFNRFIGISGTPGSITSSAVNVPIRSGEVPTKVDWLIGCSGWKMQVIRSVRFEADFTGSSIFEDVLFSVRASMVGDLYVDPQVCLSHQLEVTGRPNRSDYFEQWVSNRYRLKFVARNRFSLFRFWLTNIAFILKVTFVDKDLGAAMGIIKGSWSVVTRQ